MNINAAVLSNMLLAFSTAANNGYLRFFSSTDVLIAEGRFSATAFAAPSNGTITANAITASDAVSSGDIAYAKIFQSDGSTEVASLTVGVGTGDIRLTRLDVRTGEPIPIRSCTIGVS